MKVLFVSSGNIRGLVPFIESQGESLKKEGVDLDFYQLNRKGIYGYLKNIRALRQHVIKNKYDILHAHYGLVGLVCLLSFSGIPIVLSVMGSDAYGSFNMNGKRIKSSYFLMFLTHITLPFVNQIIVKSKNLYDYIPYKNKITTVPNGVNFSKFKPLNDALVQNKLLWLANPKDPRKNIKLLEDAIEIIGDNDIELTNPYPIKHEEFSTYLNDCSVFVLTSYNEGSPNVIKEAMACNIPVVSTDVGDVREVINNTEGCFNTSFDPIDVADKIKKALSYGKRTTGRQDIKHLESSVIAKRIISIYAKIQKNNLCAE